MNVMKKIFTVGLFAALLFIAFPVFTEAKSSDVIPNDKNGIPDKELYQAILESMNKKKGTFTKAEAAKLTSLEAFNYKKKRPDIKTLKGIGCLKGLTSLDLSCNKLKSLSGIEELTKLESLSVEENELTNIKAIKNLTKLKDLDISDNKIKSLSSIKNLTKLEVLRAGTNKLTSLSSIRNLTRLRSLYVYDNDLKSISGVEGLTNLYSLDVSDNMLTNINGVEYLVGLEGLGVSDNKLKKIPDLTKLTNLHNNSTSFIFNKISKKELREKLPKHLVTDSWWFNTELKLQYATRSLKLTTPSSFKKIKSTTKKINGTAQKNSKIRIRYKKKTIKTVKTNANGVFKFKNLNLSKYKGKTLKMDVLHIGGIETEYFSIKQIKFTVR